MGRCRVGISSKVADEQPLGFEDSARTIDEQPSGFEDSIHKQQSAKLAGERPIGLEDPARVVEEQPQGFEDSTWQVPLKKCNGSVKTPSAEKVCGEFQKQQRKAAILQQLRKLLVLRGPAKWKRCKCKRSKCRLF